MEAFALCWGQLTLGKPKGEAKIYASQIGHDREQLEMSGNTGLENK